MWTICAVAGAAWLAAMVALNVWHRRHLQAMTLDERNEHVRYIEEERGI